MLFNDIKQLDQAIKSNFMYTFVNWVKVYIEDQSMSMIDLVHWLSFKERCLFLCPLLT